MKRSNSRHSGESRPRRALHRIAVLATAALALPIAAGAQQLEDVQPPPTSLRLEALGSFYVAGHPVSRTATEIGLYGAGELIVDQMYVQFMRPEGHERSPVVLIHGGTLTGKSYETTPDGRMGWYEYFTRKGFPAYVVDQIGRARSGFDPAPFNAVRAGMRPPASQTNMRRVANDIALVRFRAGTADGKPFPDTRFPMKAALQLARQAVPDMNEGFGAQDPNPAALAELTGKLKGAVLIGHSQGGRYPLDAALVEGSAVKAAVVIEPAGCNATGYSDAQIARLREIPILVLFGDHLDAPQTMGIKWIDAFADCQAFVARVKAAGGDVTMLHTPDLGIRGNPLEKRMAEALAWLKAEKAKRLREGAL